MKTRNKILVALASAGLMMGAVNAYAESGASQNSSTDVTVAAANLLTQVNLTATFVIDQAMINTAVADDSNLDLGTLVTTCAYTNHADGDFDLLVNGGTVTTDTLYAVDQANGNNKKAVALSLVSTDDAVAKSITPGTPLPLDEHSDRDASESACVNTITVSGVIANDDLRNMEPGTYDVDFTMTAQPYSAGGGQAQ